MKILLSPPPTRSLSKGLKVLAAALILLICANLVFIWVNSAMPADASNEESKSISKSVAPYVVKDYEEMPQKQKDSEIKKLNDKLRQFAHSAEYVPLGVLSVLLLLLIFDLGTGRRLLRRTASASLTGIAFSVLCALFDEIHQIFVKGRAFELKDMAADMLGATAGVLLIFLIICLHCFFSGRARRQV